MTHEHPDSLLVDPKAPGELARAGRAARERWRTGWRVRPCPMLRCPVWVWHRPADDGGDPTGGR